MEQAVETVFLWSIRHHNSSVTSPDANAGVNPGAFGTSSALSRNGLVGSSGEDRRHPKVIAKMKHTKGSMIGPRVMAMGAEGSQTAAVARSS